MVRSSIGGREEEQRRPDPGDFFPGGNEQRKTRLADAMHRTLQVSDPEVPRALAREVLNVLTDELGRLDGAREQWVRVESDIVGLTKEIDEERGRDFGVAFSGTGRGLADALQAEARAALDRAKPVHPRFIEGYEAGVRAFGERLEGRVAEIRRDGSNALFPTPADSASSALGFSKPSIELRRLLELRDSIGDDRDAWHMALAKRAASVLEHWGGLQRRP
nr:hypothetical protein GCM10010200_026900 [Actinomadura rugatobispora]